MLESQHGVVCYRLHPANPQIVQEQPSRGLRWRTHSHWVTPQLAQDELWRLTRGQARPMWLQPPLMVVEEP